MSEPQLFLLITQLLPLLLQLLLILIAVKVKIFANG